MKLMKYFAVAACAISLLAGCDIDRFPYNEISAEKLDPSDIETILRGSYGQLKREWYYKPIHQVGEYGGDNISLSGTTSDLLMLTYAYRRTASQYNTQYLWQYSYKTVVNVNSLIELIPEGESTVKDQLLGENYFLRAFLYFNLCNVFGKPYALATDADLGVPLKLSIDITDFPPRATVKQTYDQIVSDMLKAEALMTEDKPNIYATKWAAQAYLSRIYLYMENWEKAKEYATKVIESGHHSLIEGSEYETYPQQVPETNKETIFAIRMLKDVDFKTENMEYYSAGALYATINDAGWGEMYPSSSYLELLNKNPADRRHKFIVDAKPDSAYKWMRYINATPMYVTRGLGPVDGSGNYPIVRLSTETTQTPYVNDLVSSDANGYYVSLRTAPGTKIYVKVEDAVSKRNDYPMWYIYKISYQEGQSHLYSPVMIRLGEMYLNRAEALMELGDASGALADINVIRTRANIPALTSVTMDDILDERRLELAWEAQRKYDIFRRGQTLNREYPGTHLSGTPVHRTVEPTSPMIVEFLPQSELDAYPIALEQNP